MRSNLSLLRSLARRGFSRRAFDFGRAVAGSRLGFATLPRILTYAVTFRCNARCVMCDSWRKPPGKELTLSELEGIFAQLPKLDIVRLTGGEPFLRRDLGELVELADEALQPLFLHLTTNGLKPEAVARLCEDRRSRTPLELMVSIDGLPSKHDAVRGRRGAFAAALRTVALLAPRQAELSLRLAVNQTVVDDEGVRQYHRLREVLEPYEVRNRVVVAYQQSATYSVEQQTVVAPRSLGDLCPYDTLTPNQAADLLGTFCQDLRQSPLPERIAKSYYARGAQNRLRHSSAEPNPPCVALQAHLRLLPNGDVPTCQFNTTTVGNLVQQTFKDIWWSTRAQTQRAWVRACPGCWAECEILPSALYSGDLLTDLFRRRWSSATSGQ